MPDDDPPVSEPVDASGGPVWKVGRILPGPATMSWDEVSDAGRDDDDEADDQG
jgi:hypothetical protein